VLSQGRWFRSLPQDLQQRILRGPASAASPREVIALEGAPASALSRARGEVSWCARRVRGTSRCFWIAETGFLVRRVRRAEGREDPRDHDREDANAPAPVAQDRARPDRQGRAAVLPPLAMLAIGRISTI